MANWGWDTLIDFLKTAGGVTATVMGMPQVGVPLMASGAEGMAGDAMSPSDEEIANAQPKRTGFMPQPSRFLAANREPGPMARYAPQNRQPQSGLDPEIMNYLMKYMRPR